MLLVEQEQERRQGKGNSNYNCRMTEMTNSWRLVTREFVMLPFVGVGGCVSANDQNLNECWVSHITCLYVCLYLPMLNQCH